MVYYVVSSVHFCIDVICLIIQYVMSQASKITVVNLNFGLVVFFSVCFIICFQFFFLYVRERFSNKRHILKLKTLKFTYNI